MHTHVKNKLFQTRVFWTLRAVLTGNLESLDSKLGVQDFLYLYLFDWPSSKLILNFSTPVFGYHKVCSESFDIRKRLYLVNVETTANMYSLLSRLDRVESNLLRVHAFFLRKNAFLLTKQRMIGRQCRYHEK